MTKDLAGIAQPPGGRPATTEGFIDAIGDRLAHRMGAGLALL